MANPYRGEVDLVVNGQTLPLRLSLGALAALEEQMGAEGLLPLIERFETGAFKASDLIALLYTGLKSAGWSGSQEDLREATIEGGPLGAAKCAGQLLRVTFSLPEGS